MYNKHIFNERKVNSMTYSYNLYEIKSNTINMEFACIDV